MSSSIPGATAYWINLARTQLQTNVGANNVNVWFGAALGRYIAPVQLWVQGVYNITHEWAELGSAYKVEEHYRIRNQLVVYSGGADLTQFEARMTDVFTQLAILTKALAADYTLGANVRLCLPVVDGEYIPAVDAKGNIAGSLLFDIHCEARIPTLT